MTAQSPASTDSCTRRAPKPCEPARPGEALAIRCQVRLVGGEAGRPLAAAQGRAFSALLASIGEVEVEGGEEVSP